MRDELHLMELVDRYLDGSMNAEEHAVFEARAATYPELRHLIEDLRVMRAGLERISLRTVITGSAPNTGKGWIGHVFSTALLIAVVSYSWLCRPTERTDERTITQNNQIAIPAKREASAATEAGAGPTAVAQDTNLEVGTIVHVDKQVVVVRAQVPANITEERKQAIGDSIRASAPEPMIGKSKDGNWRIALQNVLTPNGDGNNDSLTVTGAPYHTATMRIKNAKNVLIFTATSSAPAWHGLLSDGSKAANGIYTIEVQAIGFNNCRYWGRETVRLSWLEAAAERSRQRFN